MQKPNEHLNWNPSNSNSVKPAPSIIASGYPEHGEYPTENHTWLMRTIDKWLKYLELFSNENRKKIAALETKNAQLEKDIAALKSNYVLTTALNTKLNGYVLKTFQINGHSLQRNFSITHSDVGAAPSTHNHDNKYAKLDGTTVFPKIRLKSNGSYKELKGEL